MSEERILGHCFQITLLELRQGNRGMDFMSCQFAADFQTKTRWTGRMNDNFSNHFFENNRNQTMFSIF